MIAVYHFTERTPHPVAQNAYYVVDLFFCLSGFVIARAYADQIRKRDMRFAAYLGRRLIRLYPMFALGLLLGTAALLVAQAEGRTSYSAGQILAAAATNLVYLPFPNQGSLDLGGTPIMAPMFPANTPAWSLMFELVINLVFFVLWRFGQVSVRFLLAMLAAGAVLVFMCVLIQTGSIGWRFDAFDIMAGLVRTLYGFSAGVLIARLPLARWQRTTQAALGILLMLLTVALCFLPATGIAFLAAIAIVPLIVYGGAGISFNGPVFRWMGRLSYPLYCIHFPVVVLVTVTGWITTPSGLLLAGLFCLAAATALAVGVEEPLIRGLKARLLPPDRSDPA